MTEVKPLSDEQIERIRQSSELRRCTLIWDGHAMLQAVATITALKSENEKLTAALKFYASEGSWLDDIAPDPAGTSVPYTSPAYGDGGERARAALAKG